MIRPWGMASSRRYHSLESLPSPSYPQDLRRHDVPLFARKVGIRPVRRAYTYLAHLEGMGLVARGWDAAGKLHFQITARGVERLEWLRLQNSTTTTIGELIAPFIR